MDKYEVMDQVGEGAFGKVLLVRDKHADTQCVVKQISVRKMSAKEKEASKKEVELLSKMRHPNIVSFIRSFQDRGSLYIVMEYCDGGDLMRKINLQKGVLFTEEQIFDWFVQICLGLKHIHDRRILHRDIKAQNIFLTNGGMTAKLGDFGIAKMLNHTMDLARTCVGTPYYLSPEICQSRPYNNKTDIWSLGCVLYELCALRHPFEGRDLPGLISKICKGCYNPVPRLYSSDLSLLLSQLLQVNPRDRPSVSSVLRRPFLRRLIDKHLNPEVMQEESAHVTAQRYTAAASQVSRTKCRAANTPGRIQRSTGVDRSRATVNRPPTKPHWRVPLRVYTPFQHKAQGQRAAAAADREVTGQQNQRCSGLQPLSLYQHHHTQLDAFQRRNKEATVSPAAPQEKEERREDQAALPVEPYQLVAAARHEYLQRRQEAEQNKLRAEKQLGVRPCTAERSGRSGGPVSRPGHQHMPQDRRQQGQEEYLRQLEVIRQQYHKEMRQMRLRPEAGAQPQHNHGTFLVERSRDVEPCADRTDRQEAAAAQGDRMDTALRHVSEERSRRERRQQKGIMFEIHLDEGGVEEKEKEGKREEEEEEARDPFNRTLNFLEGEEMKLQYWLDERRGWSQRTPQTLMNALANMEINSVHDTLVEPEQGEDVSGRRQWVGAPPNTLLNALAQAELTSSTMDSAAADLESDKEEEESDAETETTSDDDDDDTNFEESEDELRKAVADSMKNLFVMEDERPAESEHTQENVEAHDGEQGNREEDAARAADSHHMQPELEDLCSGVAQTQCTDVCLHSNTRL